MTGKVEAEHLAEFGCADVSGCDAFHGTVDIRQSDRQGIQPIEIAVAPDDTFASVLEDAIQPDRGRGRVFVDLGNTLHIAQRRTG